MSIEDRLRRLARYDQDPTTTAVAREPGRVGRAVARVTGPFRGRMKVLAVAGALATALGLGTGYAAGELVLFPDGPLGGPPVALAPDDPDEPDEAEPATTPAKAPQARPTAKAASPDPDRPAASPTPTTTKPTKAGRSGPEPKPAPAAAPDDEQARPDPQPNPAPVTADDPAPVEPDAPEEPIDPPDDGPHYPTCGMYKDGVLIAEYEHGDPGYSECFEPNLGIGEPDPQPCTLNGVTYAPGHDLWDECLVGEG